MRNLFNKNKDLNYKYLKEKYKLKNTYKITETIYYS